MNEVVLPTGVTGCVTNYDNLCDLQTYVQRPAETVSVIAAVNYYTRLTALFGELLVSCCL
jgi:hypothetical protein